MTPQPTPPAVLSQAAIAAEVLALRPDYRALLITVTGVRGGPSDAASDAALRSAEDRARAHLAGRAPESLPQIAAWREAFAGFGIKPRAARSSIEALVRRLDAGLPRIDRLTDLYNAVSVEHLLPIGGEDLGRYAGPPRLVRARGDEPFDTIANGEPVKVTAEPGEVLWRDDLGVTCRRWNWRQCLRTRLGPTTTEALFILDALEPIGDSALQKAGQALLDAITAGTPGATAASRLLPGA